MRVLIAAAGTAGHINPALSIANKIKQEEKDSEIKFIGTERGLENDLVPRSGYELKTIDAYGLSKEISKENFKKLYKTFKGIGEANKIIKEFKPDIVIGTGGYICGAAVVAAKMNRVPVLLHESNSFPGKAVKMLALISDTVLVSFEETRNKIKGCKNVVYTGTPVRVKKKVYSPNKKQEIIKSLELDNTKPIVLVFGGSQGAQTINEALVGIIKQKLNTKYQIIWATGPKQYDIIKMQLEKENIDINNIPNFKVLSYIYNMEEVENVSDLIVSRSGAMTITEIANLGKPSILVPLPNVSNDHQMYNAKILEDAKAAIIIKNNELNGKLLNDEIEKIIFDQERFLSMGKNAFTLSNTEAEEKIYQEIQRLVKKRKLRFCMQWKLLTKSNSPHIYLLRKVIIL